MCAQKFGRQDNTPRARRQSRCVSRKVCTDNLMYSSRRACICFLFCGALVRGVPKIIIHKSSRGHMLARIEARLKLAHFERVRRALFGGHDEKLRIIQIIMLMHLT